MENKQEKLIEVFNKGKREIQYKGGSLYPEKKKKLPEAEASRLVEMFPGEVLLLSEVAVIDHSEELRKDLEKVKSEKEMVSLDLEASAKKAKELEEENFRLKEDIKSLESKLADLELVVKEFGKKKKDKKEK